MISNYFKLAVRNLFKRKGYSVLNILGLAIGMTCCLLIFQYVSYEKSYDQFSEKQKQIVRLRLDSYQQGVLAWQSAVVYPAIGPTLKKDYPEVEDFCRLLPNNLILTNTKTNVKFRETQGYFADPSAIKMLGVQLLNGDPDKALNEPDNMIISETMSKKYFGNAEAMGKQLRIPGRDRSYQVSGVFKDHPHNSHLRINYLCSYATLVSQLKANGDTSNRAETSFGWYDFYTYLQLKPGIEGKELASKLPAFCDRYMNNDERNKANNLKYTLSLIPLSDIHLYSNYKYEAGVNGNGRAVRFMFLIGFIIMAIAWVNYINLSTARSVERGKEVGVRKVLGAGKAQLIRQFLLESLLLNLVALLIACCAFYMLVPTFNSLMGREEPARFAMSNAYLVLFTGLFAAGTLLSGLYPAFVISGYKPVSVLKGAFKNTSKGLLLRKGLIIGQFGISVLLIAGTIIVFRQVNFMRHQDLGFNINQTLVLDGSETVSDSAYMNTYQPFKEELLKQTGIQGVAASTNVPGQEIFWTTGIKRMNPANAESVILHHLGVDYDFIPQFQVKMIAGRNFSKDFSTDENAAILNETAVSALGFKDPAEAMGQKLIRRRDTITIIGIVQSFHHQGLQKAIDPQVILLVPDSRNSYSIKLSSADIPKTIATVQNIWNKYFPDDPFNYFFLDDFYNQQYKADQRFGKVFTLFAMLAILIGCLGLLGLSSYNILQRTKEIGIRKVLGASTQKVVYILAKDFLVVVLIAFVVAVPFTWWLMHNWLHEFAYRINIDWWIFLIAGAISIAIALITISFQAIKAAIANPVKSLRTE
ncbi:MAG TPA: ABC transporter permease [Chitinophagaceae bacterium]|nr:ABC transporter permease [Chitinophagaceae bacterium]